MGNSIGKFVRGEGMDSHRWQPGGGGGTSTISSPNVPLSYNLKPLKGMLLVFIIQDKVKK